jgi:hypothetical protein
VKMREKEIKIQGLWRKQIDGGPKLMRYGYRCEGPRTDPSRAKVEVLCGEQKFSEILAAKSGPDPLIMLLYVQTPESQKTGYACALPFKQRTKPPVMPMGL